jgi:hypothetical protein
MRTELLRVFRASDQFAPNTLRKGQEPVILL